VEDGDDYEEIVSRFRGEVGGEAKAIIRALIATRVTDDDA
jgi:hypothetical protein